MKKHKYLEKKLKNRDGASIIIALFAFMLASILSAVIITVALNSLRQVADNGDVQSVRLNLSSAAGYIKYYFSGTEVVIKEYSDESAGPAKVEITREDGDKFKNSKVDKKLIAIVEYVVDPYSSSLEGCTRSIANESYVINDFAMIKAGDGSKISKSGKNYQINPVKVKMEMSDITETKYSLKLTLTDSTDTNSPRPCLDVYMSPVINISYMSDDVGDYKETRITWKNASNVFTRTN